MFDTPKQWDVEWNWSVWLQNWDMTTNELCTLNFFWWAVGRFGHFLALSQGGEEQGIPTQHPLSSDGWTTKWLVSSYKVPVDLKEKTWVVLEDVVLQCVACVLYFRCVSQCFSSLLHSDRLKKGTTPRLLTWFHLLSLDEAWIRRSKKWGWAGWELAITPDQMP